MAVVDVEALEAENKLMRKIGNSNGFFEHYFNVMLKECDTQKEAFDTLNEKYEDFFGEPRFSGGYNSFRWSVNNWLKSQK